MRMRNATLLLGSLLSRAAMRAASRYVLIVLVAFSFVTQSVRAADLNIDQAAKSVVLLHASAAGGTVVGTGFLVKLPDALYLVTAEHVARGLAGGAQLTFADASDVPQTEPLSTLAGSTPVPWVFHGVADVAVVELRGASQIVALLSTRALQPAHLVSKLEAPSRDRTLIVIGFPLGLGGLILGPDHHLSPLSRESKAASGLITRARFDTTAQSNFYFLDSPSIGGFSGAPVFMLSGAIVSGPSIGFTPPNSFCMGLIHGTLGDGTGGKLAAVVPTAYITETIEKAFKARRPA
jgi:hypothetical protein